MTIHVHPPAPTIHVHPHRLKLVSPFPSGPRTPPSCHGASASSASSPCTTGTTTPMHGACPGAGAKAGGWRTAGAGDAGGRRRTAGGGWSYLAQCSEAASTATGARLLQQTQGRGSRRKEQGAGAGAVVREAQLACAMRGRRSRGGWEWRLRKAREVQRLGGRWRCRTSAQYRWPRTVPARAGAVHWHRVQ